MVSTTVTGIDFVAALMVRPGKNATAGALQRKVKGSSVDLSAGLLSFLEPVFARGQAFQNDIQFVPTNGRQNEVRDSLLTLCLDTSKREEAAKGLAKRLSAAMDGRMKPVLLLVAVGQINGTYQILLLTLHETKTIFPKEQAGGKFELSISESFSEEASFFKATMFEGHPSGGGFWQGKVVDKQVRQRITDVSKYWLDEFLTARHIPTDARATKEIILAYEKTLKEEKSPAARSNITAGLASLKSQIGKRIKVADSISKYLPAAEARKVEANLKLAPDELRRDFTLDGDTFDEEISFKTLAIDNEFLLTGPFHKFDERVMRKEVGDKKVEVSIIGRELTEGISRRKRGRKIDNKD